MFDLTSNSDLFSFCLASTEVHKHGDIFRNKRVLKTQDNTHGQDRKWTFDVFDIPGRLNDVSPATLKRVPFSENHVNDATSTCVH